MEITVEQTQISATLNRNETCGGGAECSVAGIGRGEL